MQENLATLLEQRFGTSVSVPPELADLEELVSAAAHRSDRAFSPDPVPAGWTETLLACALSAPSKSDLQQVSVVRVEDDSKRAAVARLVPTLEWVPSAPLLLMFCGDSRRIRRICELRGRPFANDHLDAMFNASVDAALVMMNFIRVARAAGLGCCPLSMVRDRSEELAGLLELPDGVFPVAGMAAGFPSAAVAISPRLPLSLTVHTDRYDDSRLEEELDAYDRHRGEVQPIAKEKQRDTGRFGTQEHYGWSEDKARQVSRPQRADFGRYLREHGFRLD
jgi:nitroreductase/FMN reductase [NAD(P)H]